MRVYVILTKQNLNNCINNNNNQYLCGKSQPIYHVSKNPPCEVKMYIQAQDYREHCNIDYTITNRTIWITLHQPHSWLYSTATEQQIVIKCDNHPEYKKILTKSGRITLNDNCKLTTADMTIQTKTIIYKTIMETFLPEFNITISQNVANNKANDERKFKEVINNPLELKGLSNKLEEINKDLDNNEINFFKQKEFIYPMTFSGITTIAITILIIWTIIQYKKKKPKQPTVTIIDDIDRPYGMPRPILKRSKSTRF